MTNLVNKNKSRPEVSTTMWSNYNYRRYYSLRARVARWMDKLQRLSNHVDKWCDESPLNYLFLIGGVAIVLTVVCGVMAKLFLT